MARRLTAPGSEERPSRSTMRARGRLASWSRVPRPSLIHRLRRRRYRVPPPGTRCDCGGRRAPPSHPRGCGKKRPQSAASLGRASGWSEPLSRRSCAVSHARPGDRAGRPQTMPAGLASASSPAALSIEIAVFWGPPSLHRRPLLRPFAFLPLPQQISQTSFADACPSGAAQRAAALPGRARKCPDRRFSATMR